MRLAFRTILIFVLVIAGILLFDPPLGYVILQGEKFVLSVRNIIAIVILVSALFVRFAFRKK